MKRIAIGLLAGVSVFVALLTSGVAQAGGGGGAYACQNDKSVRQAQGGVEIAVRDSCFGPVFARVPVGSTVRWINAGYQPHNIVPLEKNHLTDNMLQTNGSSLTIVMDHAGAFVYYCAMHPGMVGTVFVTEGDGDAGIQPIPGSMASLKSQPASSDPLNPRLTLDSNTEAVSSRGGDGVPVLGVLLLALIVGTVAGGGSTWLVRKLEKAPNT